MQIDKQQILAKLTELGRHDDASRAANELPDQVDTEQHAGLLDKLGLNLSDLLGGAAGGIASKLGL